MALRPDSSVLHHPSFIPHRPSSTSHPSSVLRLLSSVLHPWSSIRPPSSVLHSTSLFVRISNECQVALLCICFTSDADSLTEDQSLHPSLALHRLQAHAPSSVCTNPPLLLLPRLASANLLQGGAKGGASHHQTITKPMASHHQTNGFSFVILCPALSRLPCAASIGPFVCIDVCRAHAHIGARARALLISGQ